MAEDGDIRAAARLAEPPPGDGYHREHVRMLELTGEPAALRDVAIAAAAAWDGRVEATAASGDDATRDALAAAGLVREASLRRGLRHGAQWSELEVWGRPGGTARALPEPPARAARPSSAGPPADVEIAWHDGTTTRALEAFASTLVPGRSYPPGTLLSEAERLETSVGRALRADWILAIAQDHGVVGGLVLARESQAGDVPARAHVRRIHLDVLPAWQGRGIATRLLSVARREASRVAACVLESDPRAGNEGACRALEKAGFELAGVQRGAWRMRCRGARWDEDVRLYRTDCDAGD